MTLHVHREIHILITPERAQKGLLDRQTARCKINWRKLKKKKVFQSPGNKEILSGNIEMCFEYRAKRVLKITVGQMWKIHIKITVYWNVTPCLCFDKTGNLRVM
jgi:hypothetical protein